MPYSDPIPPDVREGSRVLLETANWVVGIPDTMRAMYWWGAFTEWCVSSDEDMFEYFSEKGPLIVFRSRHDSFRWALHSCGGEFRNANNRRASWSGFLMRNPDIAVGLLIALAQFEPSDPPRLKPLVQGLAALAESVRLYSRSESIVAMHLEEMEGAAMRVLDYTPIDGDDYIPSNYDDE